MTESRFRERDRIRIVELVDGMDTAANAWGELRKFLA